MSVNLHIRVCVIHKMTGVGRIVSTVNLIIPVTVRKHLGEAAYLYRNFRKKVDK